MRRARRALAEFARDWWCDHEHAGAGGPVAVGVFAIPVRHVKGEAFARRPYGDGVPDATGGREFRLELGDVPHRDALLEEAMEVVQG